MSKKTSVTVFHEGSPGSTTTISNGDIQLYVDGTNSLEVKVVENGVETKRFYFRPGFWTHYNYIQTDV